MVLELDHLSKRYGGTEALRDLTLHVPAGSVYGLLGPNGSGKTTTLGLALGVLNPTAGAVRWFGQALSAASKRRVGVLLETPNFYPYLSARQNLQVVAEVKRAPTSQLDEVLETVGLRNRQHDAFQGFSLGMKQRLALASTLLGQPEVLVLDEPTNGLDPQGIAEVRTLVQRLAAEGKTIILASHLLDEIEKVCTHVAVLQRGQLRAAGAVRDILTSADRVVLRPGPASSLQALREALAQLPWISDVQAEAEGRVSVVLDSAHDPAALNEALFRQGIVLAGLELRHRSLESQFLALTS
ncbi:ABC transporter ATP-binding protein [Hymenobacter lutimineralis]|uniref:ABC transporter ATP-binding protein n=1 Tax=Hymenobacter lutimineralis TaxID=2606448 RepID=A0A5D6UZZ1_9BACT|nr:MULTISPECIES: ABC transporter ATP-binding protein [Hymenobacter]QIX63286.1 ABC transporter ATP-binding protein [Hymenobacter sp. BT18]TYZ08079.1 ABC transporter ATP-binding protein [Hymenobacter lutimineralis]